MPKNEMSASLRDDLLWGVPAIAEEIGRTKRQTHYLVEKNLIPVTRLADKTIVASRRQLHEYFSSKLTGTT